MFLPIRDLNQGRRRRSYSHGSVYGGERVARSSKLSLLSAITAQSSGSNGSNSTVTQESYNRSTRRRKSSRRKKDSSRSRPSNMEPVEEAPPEEDLKAEEPKGEDVFSFLVDGPSDVGDADRQRDLSTVVGLEADDEREPDPVPYPEDAIHGSDFSTHSFHSDSGVSLDDGSFHIGKANIQPLLPSIGPCREMPSNRRGLWHYPEVPRPQHVPVEPHQEDPGDHTTDRSPKEYNTHAVGTSSPASVFADSDPFFPLSTDHLASELADQHSPPLFKAFRKANYRILLQLQDEITELQEELAELDVYDGSRRPDKDPGTTQSLHRLSFQWGQCPFDLYKAKAEVLGRLQIRMDQYCSLPGIAIPPYP